MRAELVKLLRRRSVLVLLALLVTLSGVVHFTVRLEFRSMLAENDASVAALRDAYADGRVSDEHLDADLASLAEHRSAIEHDSSLIAFPRSIQLAVQSAATAGSLFVVLAAALALGSEFSWRTIQLLSTRAERRLILAVHARGVWLLVMGALGAIVVVASIQGMLLEGVQRGITRAQVVDVLVAVAGTVLALTVWSLIGWLGAVLTRSAGTASTVAALAWIAVPVLSMLSDAAQRFNLDYLSSSMLVRGSNLTLNGLLLPAGARADAFTSSLVAAAALMSAIAVMLVFLFSRFEIVDLR